MKEEIKLIKSLINENKKIINSPFLTHSYYLKLTHEKELYNNILNYIKCKQKVMNKNDFINKLINDISEKQSENGCMQSSINAYEYIKYLESLKE